MRPHTGGRGTCREKTSLTIDGWAEQRQNFTMTNQDVLLKKIVDSTEELLDTQDIAQVQRVALYLQAMVTATGNKQAALFLLSKGFTGDAGNLDEAKALVFDGVRDFPA